MVSFGLGWLIAGRLLRPLRLITATAREISATNLHRRLGLGRGQDEFRELGETLDDLFGRLEASFESQRHFVANASHELRTPLTAERTVLQVALADPGAGAGALRSACEEVLALGEQQERLIDALLTLASGEQGIERPEPFDLADVAGKVIAGRRAEAERRGLRLTASLAAAPASGDPSLAGSLVANLVDNALRHNMPGGWISVATSAAAGRATVSVRNTGPVIPPGEVGRLFQPFQRLGAERVRRAANGARPGGGAGRAGAGRGGAGRARARPGHRPRHRRRPRRRGHRPRPARRRPGHRGHLRPRAIAANLITARSRPPCLLPPAFFTPPPPPPPPLPPPYRKMASPTCHASTALTECPNPLPPPLSQPLRPPAPPAPRRSDNSKKRRARSAPPIATAGENPRGRRAIAGFRQVSVFSSVIFAGTNRRAGTEIR